MPAKRKSNSRTRRPSMRPKKTPSSALQTTANITSSTKVRYLVPGALNAQTFNVATLLDQFNISTGAALVPQRRAFEAVRLKAINMYLNPTAVAAPATSSFMWGQSGGGAPATPGIIQPKPVTHVLEATFDQPCYRRFVPPSGTWMAGWFSSYLDGYTVSGNNYVMATYNIGATGYIEYELEFLVSPTPNAAGPAFTNGNSIVVVTQYEICVGGCFNSAAVTVPIDWALNKVL